MSGSERTMNDIYRKLLETAGLYRKSDSRIWEDMLETNGDPDSYTALSRDRINVTGCFPWKKDQKVLCAGADYGCFAPLTSETASVDILDTEPERRELAALRYSRLAETGRLRVLVSAEPESYDVVIADLAGAGMTAVEPKTADVYEYLTRLTEYLKQGGSMLVIADNAGALEASAGELRDDAENCISLRRAGELSRELGFTRLLRYYPLPNALFAKNIFSDRLLPSQGSFKDINRYSFGSRQTVFNADVVYGRLCETGVFPEFAPSYALIMSELRRSTSDISDTEHIPEAEGDPGTPVYVRYNRSRAEAFALKTEIFEDAEGNRTVRKTALSQAGNVHIRSFENKYKLLKKEAPDTLNILEPVIGENENGLAYALFRYIKGDTLDSMLSEMISDGRAPEEALEQALAVVLGNRETAGRNIDGLFENVIRDTDGRLWIIDYEWVREEPLDKRFLRCRILSYWYDAHSSMLYGYENRRGFLNSLGVNAEVIDEYDRWEKEFQSVVGAGEKLPYGSFSTPISAAAFREQEARLAEMTEWNLRLQDEVEEHKTVLAKEREIERLSQNHIRNIEKINSAQKAELEMLREQNVYLAAHQSISSRIKRGLITRLDTWAPADSNRRRMIRYAKNTLLHPVRMLGMYLGREGRVFIRGDFRIGGEFAEGGILNIPETPSPLVSIVIPAYNQVGYTYACIRSIIANTDPLETPYEVILADDVSSDATSEIGDYIHGLIVSRNTSNMGFLKNCNQAAARARGDYILFLNNDTKVHENWLEPLVRLMREDSTIGMTGSKLVYPDGRLQEAGGIIWSDASGWNYGRLDDPDRPEYNYVRETDYISGAAIMIRADLWREIGGFDELYAPAYCEDSDLAFEVRRHGCRVVYQPQSVVTHFEGISNGTDVEGTGLKRYQKVNQEKFRKKWADELKKQSVNTGDPDPFKARDRSQEKKCVVVIDHYVPTWDRDAGSKTTFQYLKMFLKKGFNVKFIGDNFLHEEPYTTQLMQLGIEVLYGDAYRDGVFDYLKKNSANIDFCYLNRPHIAAKYIDFLKKNTDIKCIFYGHDLHYLRLFREYELSGDIRKKRESDYWKNVEYSVMEQADMVYYPSQVEIDEIHRLHPELQAKAITAYVWDEFRDSSGEDYESRNGLLFVGGFRHPPNADAVKWFAEKIFPKIREEIGDVRFYVAGSGAGEDILALADSEAGIEILGFVSDERLAQLYSSCRLVVVPLRYGAGVKGKVVEALYNNAVVVTTSVGAEGIPGAEGIMKVTDDSPETLTGDTEEVENTFAGETVSLYRDTGKCAEMSRACSKYMREHFSIDAAWSVIEEDFSR